MHLLFNKGKYLKSSQSLAHSVIEKKDIFRSVQVFMLCPSEALFSHPLICVLALSQNYMPVSTDVNVKPCLPTVTIHSQHLLEGESEYSERLFEFLTCSHLPRTCHDL